MFQQLTYDEVKITKRRRLPHWDAGRGLYAVTFSLFDAIPPPIREEMCRRIAQMEADILRGKGEISADDKFLIEQTFRMWREEVLDSSYGECHLRTPAVADLVSDALNYFNFQRYDLLSWSVMPNHVHVVFEQLAGFSLARILHSWKSFTGKAVLELIPIEPPFRLEEYWDTLIRDERHLENEIAYAFENPIRGGLANWKWCWRKGL